MDEPTKGIDAVFKEKFAEIIAALKMRGVAIMMVSHDIEFCAEYADRCALFFDGNIASQASAREFFSGQKFLYDGGQSPRAQAFAKCSLGRGCHFSLRRASNCRKKRPKF